MKSLLVAFAFFNVVSAQASHRVSCDVEVEVIEVRDLARLGDSAIFARPFPGSPVLPDHEKTITFKVKKVSNVEGQGNCHRENAVETLWVKDPMKFTAKNGDQLKLHYENFGDRVGSKITWTVR